MILYLQFTRTVNYERPQNSATTMEQRKEEAKEGSETADNEASRYKCVLSPRCIFLFLSFSKFQ
jgi:hypothetical protein